MSHTLTPSPANRILGITVPDPGDPRTAASVVTPIQQLTDTLSYMQSRSPGVVSTNFAQFSLASARNDDVAVANGWVFTNDMWIVNSISPTAQLIIDLPLPAGVTLTRVGINTKGSISGAHSGNVAGPPVITLDELDPANSLGTTVNSTFTATATDPTGGNLLSGYDSAHNIEITSLTHTVNGLRRYRLRISGENGSHAATSKFAVFGAYASWNP